MPRTASTQLERHAVPDQTATRRLAQHALLAALRDVHPAPLVELRDGLLAAPVTAQTADTGRPPARSKARQAAIHRAQRRVQALEIPTVEKPPIVDVVDVEALLAALQPHYADPVAALRDGLPKLPVEVPKMWVPSGTGVVVLREDVEIAIAWADRWHLRALLDMAPYLRAYWRKRPAAGARFAFVPRVLTMRSTASIDVDPDRDAEDDVVARAKALYADRAAALSVVPVRRRRQPAYASTVATHVCPSQWPVVR